MGKGLDGREGGGLGRGMGKGLEGRGVRGETGRGV